MANQFDRQDLQGLLVQARRSIFFKNAVAGLLQAGLIALPIAAILIAASQRWAEGQWNALIAVITGVLLLAVALFRGLASLGPSLNAALALDKQAGLKDRVSSACEFLESGQMDEARAAQVQDALRRARSLDLPNLFRISWPKYAAGLPLLALLFLLSFLVPPLANQQTAQAAEDAVKQLQLEELKDLEDQLAFGDVPSEELKDVLEKIREIQKRFEEGGLSARDVMLHLARLDEQMRQKAMELGVENLETELNTIVPHLMSAAAAQQVAAALKDEKLEEAMAELKELSDKVKQDKLSEQEKRELAMSMGLCASKLGQKNNASFGGNFSSASQALENSDAEAFEGECNSIGDKLDLLKKARVMKLAAKKIGLCKGGLGQCAALIGGYKQGPKTQSKKKGGLMAGTGATGDPLGEASRLSDSYRNLVRVTGQAGEGPVETELEITDGQLSPSQVSLKELHADYAAVAEEAIENESIPLSHRFHVKRYFQSIRPQE